jgi:transposase
METSTAMKTVTTVGIDLAKNVFQVHGVNARGNPVLQKQLKRAQVLTFFSNRTPCLIGMEACGGAHFWARELAKLGHTVKLMAPQFVKPYVKTNKNDARDAEGICEAVSRPSMRFVAVKSPEQQALLSVHRARQGFVDARTATANQIRGLLTEFGLIMPKGIWNIDKRLPDILEDAENNLPPMMRELTATLRAHFKHLDSQVKALDAVIARAHREQPASRQLAAIPGIGPVTATALVATVGDARQFKSGRQVAAWLGLVPHQNSSGGKERLLGISKRGDVYLRTLLIHGARAVVREASKHPESDTWLMRLVKRRHPNIATVALANKNARIAWALLAHPERKYQTDYTALQAAA